MSRKSKSLQEKIKEQFPEFMEEVQSLKVEELNARLAQAAKDAEAVAEAKAEDNALQTATDHAKELGAPYREAKAALKLKTKYLCQLVKERQQ